MKKTAKSVPGTCPICGADGTLAARREPFAARYNQIELKLKDVESYVCRACGEGFFDKPQSQALSQRIKEAARGQLGLLPPQRIVALRRRLGLSQEALEELLGLGDKVVTRWENGRVLPGRATDDLLRLMERVPGVVDALQEIQRERALNGTESATARRTGGPETGSAS